MILSSWLCYESAAPGVHWLWSLVLFAKVKTPDRHLSKWFGLWEQNHRYSRSLMTSRACPYDDNHSFYRTWMYVVIVLVVPVLVMIFLNSVVISVITKMRAKQMKVSALRAVCRGAYLKNTFAFVCVFTCYIPCLLIILLKHAEFDWIRMLYHLSIQRHHMISLRRNEAQ